MGEDEEVLEGSRDAEVGVIALKSMILLRVGLLAEQAVTWNGLKPILRLLARIDFRKSKPDDDN